MHIRVGITLYLIGHRCADNTVQVYDCELHSRVYRTDTDRHIDYGELYCEGHRQPAYGIPALPRPAHFRASHGISAPKSELCSHQPRFRSSTGYKVGLPEILCVRSWLMAPLGSVLVLASWSSGYISILAWRRLACP